MPPKAEVNPVDLHVGGRIRVHRRLRRLSQQSLARAIGVTFQQVQKYERGANRVSASKLYAIACILEAPVAQFFEGLPQPGAGAALSRSAAQRVREAGAFLADPHGHTLARAFLGIKRQSVRRQLVALVNAIVSGE